MANHEPIPTPAPVSDVSDKSASADFVRFILITFYLDISEWKYAQKFLSAGKISDFHFIWSL